MKKLLETLYVTTPDSYLFCRNENICVKIGGEEKASVPAVMLDGIVCFGEMTVSTPLIGFCAEHGITLTFLSSNGRFYSRICGPVSGNVLLRKKQYQALDDDDFRMKFVQNLLVGKLLNEKNVLMRTARTQDAATAESLRAACQSISQYAAQLETCAGVDQMRGIEGAAAKCYFAHFDDMISPQCPFQFVERSRRPPRNEVNAVLSFMYTLQTRDIQAALETVGLDPAAGWLHTLRPGRPSLALDLLEEFRAPLCDRLALSLFNKRQLTDKDFEYDSLAVMLNERGRKTVLTAWRDRKQEEITHPYLGEKIQVGLIAYVQAMMRRVSCAGILIAIRRLSGGEKMLVVVTYDVNTATEAGAARLRRVAKLCERYGRRVQNSVFEVLLDAAQLTALKAQLAATIDAEHDSVRFYRLGNSYKERIDVLGCTARIEAGELLML